ncbi:fluoride efflux transporter CrcB [Gracilibacillus sp. YIM 98692]|uniref:fluoride efflux transporter CrcB n=1 Tax=Gracilibacillus sp. YIM 98692 TaxID=2663532 RepID=UPI0013D3F244|nr:fluoride efflux transporter CrcB [Gracilibacillus sp. YIM 98692]
MNFLFVALGGSIGALLRHWFSRNWNTADSFLPIGTLFANILGSAILAISYIAYQSSLINSSTWYFVGVGLCGAFTTFSTFSVELMKMFEDDEPKRALLYLSISLLISITVVGLILVGSSFII